MKEKTILVIILVSVGVLAWFQITGSSPTFGGSSDVVVGRVASSSLQSVGPQQVMTVAATTTCSARILSTSAKPVMLTFTDADTPTGMFGVLQAASSTVVYDNTQYGCGKIKAYGFDASTTVTYLGVR